MAHFHSSCPGRAHQAWSKDTSAGLCFHTAPHLHVCVFTQECPAPLVWGRQGPEVPLQGVKGPSRARPPLAPVSAGENGKVHCDHDLVEHDLL